jgi:tetratricopeptide (TPR) repeat protein
MPRFSLFLFAFALQFSVINLAAFDKKDVGRQWVEEDQAVDSLYKAIFKNPIEARSQINVMIERSHSVLPDTILAKFYNLLGISYAVTSNNDSAIYAFNKALKMSPLVSSFKANVKKNIGNVFRNSGAFDKAFDFYYAALSDSYVLQDEHLTSVLYGEISSTYSLINKPEFAIDYLQMAVKQNEEISDKDNLSLAILYQKLANIYSRQNDYELSKHYHEIVLPILLNSNRKDVYYLSLINLSVVYLNQDDPDAALTLLHEAQAGVRELNLSQLSPLVYMKYINVYFHLGENDSVESMYAKMISEINFSNANHLAVLLEYAGLLLRKDDFNDLENVVALLDTHHAGQAFFISDLILYQEMKARLFAHQMRYKEAYDALSFSASISDSLRLSDAYAALHGLSRKAELEKQIQQTVISHQKVKLSNRLSIIVLIILIFILLAGVYVVKIKDYRQRILLLENQRLESLYKQETERITQQKKAYIDTSNENIILKERLQKLVKKHGDDLDLDFSSWKADSQLLQTIIKRSELIDNQWLDKIKRSFPALTRSELEFCLLLHLGLSYKEIAQLLNISHTSVHTKKYRLNKKVALPSDMDLLAWLYRVANDAKS